MDGRRRAPSCGEGGTLGGDGTKLSPLGKRRTCGLTRASHRRRRFPRRPCRGRGRQRAWVRVRDEAAWGQGWWVPHEDQGPGQSHRRERGRQRAGCGEAGPGVLGRGVCVEGRREGGGMGLAGTWPKDGPATRAGPLQKHGGGGDAVPGTRVRLGQVCGRGGRVAGVGLRSWRQARTGERQGRAGRVRDGPGLQGDGGG